jgi:hypothetical protein
MMEHRACADTALSTSEELVPVSIYQESATDLFASCHCMPPLRLRMIVGEARVLGPLKGKASPSYPTRAEAYIRYKARRHSLLLIN